MQEFNFSKDLEEMNDAELRATLREFRNEYDEAREDYDELQDKVDQYKADLEDAEDKAEIVDEVHPQFASMFAEMKDLDEEVVADKFTTDELVEDLEEAGCFQLETATPEDGPEDENENESEFSEKEQKSRKTDDEVSEFSERIESFMDGKVRTY